VTAKIFWPPSTLMMVLEHRPICSCTTIQGLLELADQNNAVKSLSSGNNRKHSKYCSIISSNYVFKGLAFETLGPWCKEAIDFINVIGNRLIAESGDSKSKKFFFERISLAIQHGNAASIRGTFPDSAILSEIFVL
jgi:hypothetical protein